MGLLGLGSRRAGLLAAAVGTWLVAGCNGSSSNGTSSSGGTHSSTGSVTGSASGTAGNTATAGTSGTPTGSGTTGATAGTPGSNGTTGTPTTSSSSTGTGTAGSATVLASGLSIGFPGGIGISSDSSTLFVSSQDPATGTDAVAEVVVASGTVSYALSGTAANDLGPLVEPAGLQGNGTQGVYSFVDGLKAVYALTATGTTFSAPVVVANSGFKAAFDAVDDGQGDIFFTGLDSTGSTVFSTFDNGSSLAATDMAISGITSGFGIAISSDGTTLFVADPGFETDTLGTNGNITGTTLGQIVSIDDSTSNAAASPVTGTAGYVSVGCAILGGTSDTLYFTGRDPANGNGGLFSVSSAGGTVSVVAEGAPFANPSGVVVVAGKAYVVDTGRVLAVTLP